jgi:uncharacterized protein
MLRTCVGCLEVGPAEPLVRVVLGPDGSIVPDLASGAVGRGAWIHARAACIKKGVPRGFAKSFKTNVVADQTEFVRNLSLQAERRAFALLGSALRAGRGRAGTTQVRDAINGGGVELVIVARDARAAADAPWIDALVGEGRARAFATKELLGRAIGREEIGVIAILDVGLASALKRALDVADLGLPGAAGRSAGASLFTEAG